MITILTTRLKNLDFFLDFFLQSGMAWQVNHIKLSKAILLNAMLMISSSFCLAEDNPNGRLSSVTETKEECAANPLQDEVEKLALSLPEKLPNELRSFLPDGAKGTSREECLVLRCDTIIKENNVMPCIFELLLQKIQTKYELTSMERVKLDERTYWVVSISSQAGSAQKSSIANDINVPDRATSVTIWMDVTHSNQHYSIEERDKALNRASHLDDEITAIFDSITDYESAEAAAKKLKPLVDRFEKEMHIVVLGTPDGEQWELSVDNQKRSIIWDRLLNKRFFDSFNLYRIYTQICSCYISNTI